MDEVARAVSTAFTVSNDLRRTTELVLLFTGAPVPAARKIEFFGDRLRYLNPDERSTAALVKNALVRSATLDRPIEASPGVRVSPTRPLDELRQRVEQSPPPIWLTEGAPPLEEWRPTAAEASFILSDPFDPTSEESQILTASGVDRRSVGPRSLRSSQVIDVVNNYLDRLGVP